MNKLKNKFNNFGFTLVEMVVAFAILGVSVLAIGGFMITGIRSYNGVNAETQVQNEAQTALTQVQELAIDASLGISYNNVTSDGADHFVKTDLSSADLGGLTIEAKYFYVFNWNKDRNAVQALIIKFDPAEQKLYYQEKTVTGSETDTTSISTAVDVQNISSWDVLAEGVEVFSIDMSSYETTGKITASIKMVRQGKSFATSLVITLRNNVLINPQNIGEIYSRADQVIKTDITGLDLKTSSNTVVKGGTVQLSTRVLGTGYPSQNIYQWTIYAVGNGVTVTKNSDTGFLEVTGEETAGLTLLYDSLSDDNSGTASVDAATKILKVASDCSSTYLKITATVYGGGKKDTDGNVIYYSASRYVAVKDIHTFTIQPNPDLTLSENASTLVRPSNGWTIATTATDYAGNYPSMDAYPGNIIQMVGSVMGGNLDADDQGIDWSISASYTLDGSSSALDVSIDSNGLIRIGSNCLQGRVMIKASPKLNSNMVLYYQLNIGNKYGTASNTLEITGNSTVDRGDTLALGLKLNTSYTMSDRELSDFNWSVAIDTDKTITGSPVSISDKGVITVSTDLAFDYEFKLLVTASMKSNPAVSTTRIITVPRVSLKMNPTTVFSKRGSTISEGTIKCVVTGIKDYTLDWTMASQTNPRYFAANVGNGSYITGKGNSCVISISGKEPQTLTYMRARATLEDHTNYTAETYISLADISLSVSPTQTKISRGGSSLFTATVSPSDGAITASSVTWDIKSVTCGEETLTDEGLTLSSTKGSSTTLSVDKNFTFSSSDITVILECKLGSFTKEATITIPAMSGFSIKGDTSVIRGGSVELDVNSDYSGYNVDWEIVSADAGTADMKLLSLTDTKDGKKALNVSVNYDTSNRSTTSNKITVKATLHGTKMSATKDIYVTQVTISLTASTKDRKTFTCDATITGITGEGYSVAWGINTDKSVPEKTISSGTTPLKTKNGGEYQLNVTNSSKATVSVTKSDSSVKQLEAYAAIVVDGNTLCDSYADLILRDNLLSYYDLIKKSFNNSLEVDVTKNPDKMHKDYMYKVVGDRYNDKNNSVTYFRVAVYNKEKNGPDFNYYGPGTLSRYDNSHEYYYFARTNDGSWSYIDGSSSNKEWTAISEQSSNDVFKFTSNYTAEAICDKLYDAYTNKETTYLD